MVRRHTQIWFQETLPGSTLGERLVSALTGTAPGPHFLVSLPVTVVGKS